MGRAVIERSGPGVLGLIPARGGSKGIPRKNIALLRGQPLIGYTIQAASESEYVNRIVVSTDDREIADVSQGLGAEVPALRPLHLSQDDTPSIDVALYQLEALRRHEGYIPDVLVLLQPTSPLRTAQDIDAAVKLLIEADCDSVVSVCPVEEHPYLMYSIDGSGALQPYAPSWPNRLRRQDYPPAFRLNGAIYAIRPHVLSQERSFVGEHTRPLIMPRDRSIDIDVPSDLDRAAAMLQERGEHNQ